MCTWHGLLRVARTFHGGAGLTIQFLFGSITASQIFGMHVCRLATESGQPALQQCGLLTRVRFSIAGCVNRVPDRPRISWGADAEVGCLKEHRSRFAGMP